MGEDVQVVLARLEGRIEGLTEIVTLRLQTQERDLESHRVSRDEEGRKLRQHIAEVAATVTDLQNFKSKVVGVAVGLSLASGIVSGLMVTLLTGGNGG